MRCLLSCFCLPGLRRAGGCGGISGSAFAPVVSPARQFLSALRRPGHLLSCRAWCCTVSCASHCCCSAVLLGRATSHSMGAHPLSAPPRALGPPSSGVGGPCLLLGLLACWALALLSALAARSVWSAALGPPSSGVGGPCSQLGPRVAIRACCPLRMERGARPPVFWRGGPLLPAGPSCCYPRLLPAAKSAALCSIAFSTMAVGVQAQVAKQGAPTAACRPKRPGKELLQRRAGPSGLQEQQWLMLVSSVLL